MSRAKCRVLQSGDANVTQTFHYAGVPDRDGRTWNYYHGGVDLVRYFSQLDWIVAHTAGTVVGICTSYTGPTNDGSYGNYVMLKHSNGYMTVYAHLATGTTKVKLGQKVKKGQVLAYMDNTGYSKGGHLHFEVRNKAGVKIDPYPYLNSDLPNMRKVHFRSYDIKQGNWLPPVKNGSVGNQVAGNMGHKMGCVTMKSKTLRGYNVKRKTLGWGKKITGYGTKRGEYAGSKRYATVAIAIDDPHVAYQVILVNGKKLPVVYGRDYDLKDHRKGYAGDGKTAIALLNVWVV